MAWAQRKEIDCPGDADLNAILDEEKLPSHSPEYRSKYHPSYRVVSADWNKYIEAVRQINGKRSEKRLLVTIDGPCASGKTTLAKRLADLLMLQCRIRMTL